MRIFNLAKFLYKNFEMAFIREWDDLPEYIKEYWLGVAKELDPEFKKFYIDD